MIRKESQHHVCINLYSIHSYSLPTHSSCIVLYTNAPPPTHTRTHIQRMLMSHWINNCSLKKYRWISVLLQIVQHYHIELIIIYTLHVCICLVCSTCPFHCFAQCTVVLFTRQTRKQILGTRKKCLIKRDNFCRALHFTSVYSLEASWHLDAGRLQQFFTFVKVNFSGVFRHFSLSFRVTWICIPKWAW